MCVQPRVLLSRGPGGNKVLKSVKRVKKSVKQCKRGLSLPTLSESRFVLGYATKQGVSREWPLLFFATLWLFGHCPRVIGIN